MYLFEDKPEDLEKAQITCDYKIIARKGQKFLSPCGKIAIGSYRKTKNFLCKEHFWSVCSSMEKYEEPKKIRLFKNKKRKKQ